MRRFSQELIEGANWGHAERLSHDQAQYDCQDWLIMRIREWTKRDSGLSVVQQVMLRVRYGGEHEV